MKQKYRGHEIEAKREKSMGGDVLLYFSIFRTDGFEVTSGFTYGTDKITDFMKHLRARVDEEIAHPEAADA
jgi:hypothetical protein